MKNVDLIRKFGNGAISGKCGNLKIVGNCLINYSTIIAQRVKNGIKLNTRN